mmetsp:Transcript_34772/g.48398  ORF Transcript_34772/g.48398 Transcript_34772/m.48398 type:complete len:91 (+) Transcript_34772:505-777(+)
MAFGSEGGGRATLSSFSFFSDVVGAQRSNLLRLPFFACSRRQSSAYKYSPTAATTNSSTTATLLLFYYVLLHSFFDCPHQKVLTVGASSR